MEESRLEPLAGVQPASSPIPISLVDRRAGRALFYIQFAAVAATLAAVTFNDFELDRFFVPKELILHLAALLAGFLLLRALSTFRPQRVDYLLLGYVVLSSVSAILATNHWAGMRAVAISASSLLLFWAGRWLRASGLGRPLLVAIGLAVAVGNVTSLLQAHGVETGLFSENRSPGGTLGNRNFVAHLAAFGLPVVLLCALRARNFGGYFIAAIGAAVLACSIILTRSRAGWIAAAAAGLVVLLALVISPLLRSSGRTWLRFAGILLFAGVGIAAAVRVPNDLDWRSENPYLESMRGVANFQEGSGRGRLVQYGQSFRMALTEPLLGVGPGNWPVRYPEDANPNDPSLDQSAPGTTANPWPSSDWVAAISERGFAAAIVLILAFGAMALTAFRGTMTGRDVDEALQAATLFAVGAATTVVGLFDAFLLLGLPALVVWPTMGALLPPVDDSESTPASGRLARAAGIFLIVLSAVGVARSASQLVSMGAYTLRDDSATLLKASAMDPGNYRLHLRLARSGGGRSRAVRCEHALAARSLFPNAAAARQASRGCN